MNKKTFILMLFGCLSVIILSVPLSMIVTHEGVLESGSEFKFRTAPVDPFDAFRGRYVALSIENTTAIKDRNVRAVPGQYVYAGIEVESDGFAHFTKVTQSPPKGQAFMKCRVRGVQRGEQVDLIVPIDRYYMGETLAPQAERLYREHSGGEGRDAYVLVAINAGIPVIKKLYVAGKPIEDLIRQGVDPEPGIPVIQVDQTSVKESKPATAGNGVCDPGEYLVNVPEDCGRLIYPLEADVDACSDGSGKRYTATGEAAARWFNYGGCPSEKVYRARGELVVFYVYGDDCETCVCYDADFTVFESDDRVHWQPKHNYRFQKQKGLNVIIEYFTQAEFIKVAAKNCFYLDVYRGKDE